MIKPEKISYTAHVTATGGRDGRVRSSDGLIDFALALPKEMGGSGTATNPEQLFGAGYAACFIGAMKFVAGQKKLALPADVTVDANIGIGRVPTGFGLQVELVIHLPGMPQAQAQELVEAAHQVCPYSNATRGNIEVTLTLKN